MRVLLILGTRRWEGDILSGDRVDFKSERAFAEQGFPGAESPFDKRELPVAIDQDNGRTASTVVIPVDENGRQDPLVSEVETGCG